MLLPARAPWSLGSDPLAVTWAGHTQTTLRVHSRDVPDSSLEALGTLCLLTRLSGRCGFKGQTFGLEPLAALYSATSVTFILQGSQDKLLTSKLGRLLPRDKNRSTGSNVDPGRNRKFRVLRVDVPERTGGPWTGGRRSRLLLKGDGLVFSLYLWVSQLDPSQSES